MDKINRAVKKTRRLILTYDNKPINATFFLPVMVIRKIQRTTGQIMIPYLRSVPSPWDEKLSPRYKDTVYF